MAATIIMNADASAGRVTTATQSMTAIRRLDAVEEHVVARIKISARSVRRDYFIERVGETVPALADFTADIYESEFVCIVGPSGCGKSTFLRLVAGLDRLSNGSLTVDGAPIRGPSAERGMAFQAYALFPWKTLAGNVEFGPRMRHLPRKQRKQLAGRFIELVGLRGFENKYPHELSGGQQQRGSLARLFANDPDVLLMDEPLAAVDAQTREFLQEELLNLWSAYRKTVLFVTHSIEEAVFLSDRIVIMSRRPGRIKAIVENKLPRPRTFELRSHEDFARLEHEVGVLIREEINTH
jgi:NitT/TauT family transport system ATP-binding protein